jgi:cell division protease FtsH
MKKSKSIGILLLIGLVLFFLYSQRSFQAGGRALRKKIIPYSEFLDLVERGAITTVVIGEGIIKGFIEKGTKEPFFFYTHIPGNNDANLINFLHRHKVHFAAEHSSWGTKFLSSFFYNVLVGFALIFFLWYFLFRPLRNAKIGGGLPFTQSKARLFVQEEGKKITFEDVAGVQEAKDELREIIEFLKAPAKFQKLGGRMPKGILLVGPPGTGKTLLAKAVAGEAGVKFFSISGSDFVEMFVGVGASRVRDLFEQGKRNKPCIIFIDEIDAVGRQRGAGLGGGHDEREQTLNQLLVEMDGFSTQEGVILIAATNRPDVLDPALLRPGRFDRHIVVGCPDLKEREEILKVHLKDKVIADDVDPNFIARRTPGFVGSDLANVVNEAALLAARNNKDKITLVEIEQAIERVIAGPEKKSRLISSKEKEIVAYHEAGHALITKLIPDTDPVHKISIMPRGTALGYTLQLPTQDRYIVRKSELMAKMKVLLGGRAAEQLIFKEETTGAQNDLENATELAHRLVCQYGMSDLGPLTFGGNKSEVFLGRDFLRERNYSEEVAAAIDREVRKIVEENYSFTFQLLQKNRDKLERIARRLFEKEVIDGEELDRLIGAEEKKK